MEFKKNYTRDTALIIQQVWAREFSKGFAEKRGLVNPYLPTIIHFLVDGSIEIWDNTLATEWLMEELLQVNKKDGSQIQSDLGKYLDVLIKVKKYWSVGAASDLEDFQKYLVLLRDGMFLFNAWYYTATNEKTPKALLDIVLEVRKDDAYFAQNDIFIRASLRKLYPTLAGCETALLIEEVANPPEVSVLQSRMKGAALIDGQELFIGSHDDFKKKYSQFALMGDVAEKGAVSVKGQVAFKGKCQGVVRVLRRRDQVGDVKQGEVIVSPMTTPDFLPAMEKAIAFVTDEGGITCHAAIVAREMKKPCIIGTKVATQVFKDGDMVEVDAEKGIVTIIKRADES